MAIYMDTLAQETAARLQDESFLYLRSAMPLTVLTLDLKIVQTRRRRKRGVDSEITNTPAPSPSTTSTTVATTTTAVPMEIDPVDVADLQWRKFIPWSDRHRLAITECGRSQHPERMKGYKVSSTTPLGQGTFCVVYPATNEVAWPGRALVLKTVRPELKGNACTEDGSPDDLVWQPVLREIYTGRSVRQMNQTGDLARNLAQLLDVFVDHHGMPVMVYDRMATDATYVDRFPWYRAGVQDPVTRLRWLRQVTQAVVALHHMGLVHRDIKSDNVLVSGDGALWQLSDFNSTRNVSAMPALCTIPLESAVDDKTLYVVTRWYRPPEVAFECDYNRAIDIWSLGCFYITLLNRGCALLSTNSAMQHRQSLVQALGTATAVEHVYYHRHSACNDVWTQLHKNAKEAKGMLWTEWLPRLPVPPTEVEVALLRHMLTYTPVDRWSAVAVMAEIDRLIVEFSKETHLRSPVEPARALSVPLTLA
jgi:serine/threonine protein kinase